MAKDPNDTIQILIQSQQSWDTLFSMAFSQALLSSWQNSVLSCLMRFVIPQKYRVRPEGIGGHLQLY